MPKRALLFVVLVTLVALVAACEDQTDDGVDGDATPSPTLVALETVPPPTEAGPTATPTPPPGIREEDLENRIEVLQFIASTIGAPEEAEVEVAYADVTGDGLEDGIVLVSPGGTLGNIAVFVFGYTADGLEQLLREEPPREARGGHIRAQAEGGQLVVSWPIYGPDDPNCCPSGGTRVRAYRWDGAALVLDDEAVEP